MSQEPKYNRRWSDTENGVVQRITDLECRFNEHMVIYANNGKELARLAERMDAFIDKFEKHDEAEMIYHNKVSDSLERLSKLDMDSAIDMVNGYRGILTVKNIIKGLSALLLAIGAIGASVVWIIRSVN